MLIPAWRGSVAIGLLKSLSLGLSLELDGTWNQLPSDTPESNASIYRPPRQATTRKGNDQSFFNSTWSCRVQLVRKPVRIWDPKWPGHCAKHLLQMYEDRFSACIFSQLPVALFRFQIATWHTSQAATLSWSWRFPSERNFRHIIPRRGKTSKWFNESKPTNQIQPVIVEGAGRIFDHQERLKIRPSNTTSPRTDSDIFFSRKMCVISLATWYKNLWGMTHSTHNNLGLVPVLNHHPATSVCFGELFIVARLKGCIRKG